MSFLQSFGSSFLDGLGKGIDERQKKAEDYEERRREMAARNAPLFRARMKNANNAYTLANQAMTLGAKRYQVEAAMSSGYRGIEDFYNQLKDTANERGVRTLSDDDIEGMINLPSTMPTINDSYVDYSLQEFANRTYGVDPASTSQMEDTGGSFSLGNLFRVNDMKKARNRLRQEQYMGDLSIADINDLAAQAEYTSVFPELGMSLLDVEFYGPEDTSEFIKDFTDAAATSQVGNRAADDIVQLAKNAAIEAAGDEELSPEILAEVEREARRRVAKDAVTPLVVGAIGKYGRGGFFDSKVSVDLVEKILGKDFIAEQRSIFKDDDDDEQVEGEPIVPTQEEQSIQLGMEEFERRSKPADRIEDSQFQESSEAEAPNTETQKETLLAKTFPTRKSKRGLSGKGEWDRKYEGKVNPETGKVIIAPPKPPEGGGKTKEIPVRVGPLGAKTGKKKKVTEAEWWDITYGETHDVNGIPKGL